MVPYSIDPWVHRISWRIAIPKSCPIRPHSGDSILKSCQVSPPRRYYWLELGAPIFLVPSLLCGSSHVCNSVIPRHDITYDLDGSRLKQQDEERAI